MSEDDHSTAKKLTRNDLMALLGPPPLLSSESVEHYDQLCDRVADSLGAGDDIIPLILVRRFVDNALENLRYSRHRAITIDRRARQSLQFQDERKQKQQQRKKEAPESIASKLGVLQNDFTLMKELEHIWAKDIRDVEEILDRTPTELEHNSAMEATIHLQGQFDVLINSSARRQDSALELVERYRQLKPAKEILEGEYEEIEPPLNQIAAPRLVQSEEDDDDVGT
jgi:hypothetical protein